MKKRFWSGRSLLGYRRWLTPGIGLKRWLILLGLGSGFIGIGLVFLVEWVYQAGWLPQALHRILILPDAPPALRVLLALMAGGLIILVAVTRLGNNLAAPFRHAGQGFIESVYDYSQRNRGPHIVAIGGGTGMPGLLRGLRQHTRNITAIVTVADDGGSSGRLPRNAWVTAPR